MNAAYFLTQILDAKVFWRNKKIGKLADVLIVDREGPYPAVSSLIVARPYGDPSLAIPIGSVLAMSAKRIEIQSDDVEHFAINAPTEGILLKDHVLDKKVLDTHDNEVEIVYDIKLTSIGGALYATDVDLSRYGLLRRVGLKWLADIIYNPKERGNPDMISWKYIQHLPEGIGSFKGHVKLNVLREMLHEIDPVDLADIIEELNPPQRAAVFGTLNLEHASDTLEEIEPHVQRELLPSLKKERVAQLINEMTPAQAADVLSALPASQADEILPMLEPDTAMKIRSIMERQEASIMDFVTPDCIRFAPDVTIEKVEEEYPRLAKGKDLANYLYVVEENGALVGVAGLKAVLLADDARTLREIMDGNPISLEKDVTLREARDALKRYHFQGLPIIDKAGILLGVVLYRDIVDLRHNILEQSIL